MNNMTRLTEGMVIGRTKASDLNNVRSLNCWGSELSDVSLVRQMKNVEVLSLSVNKITTLEDFGHCPNLAELYVRKNVIKELSDIIYLKDLPRLKNLWLEDNPCAVGERYRLTVLKYLPNLKKLDNKIVEPDEVQKAAMYGETLASPSDLQRSGDVSPTPKIKAESLSSSPPRHSRSPDNKCTDLDSEGNTVPVLPAINNTTITISPEIAVKQEIPVKLKDTRHLFRSVDSVEVAPQNVNNDYSPSSEDGRPFNRMARRSISETGSVTPTMNVEKRIAITSPIEGGILDIDQTTDYNNQHQVLDETAIAHSAPFQQPQQQQHSAQPFQQAHAYPQASAIRPNAYLEDNLPQQQQQQQHHQGQFEYNQYRYQSTAMPQIHHIQQRTSTPLVSGVGSGVAALHSPLQGHNVIQQRQFFEKFIGDLSNKPYGSTTTRPKNRNSNILSAVLCLIKELDCASLEVVEMAVRCRMDELD